MAVVVAHDPGPWFDETLAGLAAQDYPSLRVLVVDTSPAPADPDDDPVVRRLAAHLPDAFLHRSRPGGHAAAANEVLRLVEGGGFFCLLHDDVALEPDAVRLLVEELYRSNAGIVGPKLVTADDPARLQAVGLEVDRFGELAPPTGAGELDQEQHDAVADVFAVPSACLLVRADLFRTLGGFDDVLDGPGDEIDLCWRAHLSGARVLVVPAARARHRGLPTGAYDHVDPRAAKNRLRCVLANYSLLSLARLVPQIVVLGLVRSVAFTVTGRFRRAAQPFEAWIWNLARLPSLVRKRRAVGQVRRVHDGEIRRLQKRGSARLVAALRDASIAREAGGARVAAGARSALEQVRSGSHWPVTLTWIGVVATVVVGSRGLVVDGVAPVGQLLSVPQSAVELVRRPFDGWSPRGLGAVGPVAPALGLFGLLAVVLAGATEAARTVAVIAPLLIGPLGIWRLTRSFGVRRARLVGVIAYAANPLPYNALAVGRWPAALAFAVLPWFVGGLARLAGWAPTSGLRHPVAQTVAGLAVAVAVTGAAVPALAPVLVLTAVLLAVGSLAAGERNGIGALLAGTVLAVVAAAVLLGPWSWQLATGPWAAFVGDDGTGSTHAAVDVLRFAVGPHGTSPLPVGLWIGAVGALALGSSWRAAWGARATVLAAGATVVALAAERGLGPAAPDTAVLLAPAAVGLALAAASTVAAGANDLAGSRLTWRQPLVLLVLAGLAAAAVPTLAAAADGRWDQPRRGLVDDLALLPVRDTPGAFRTLWVGAPGTVAPASWPLGDGLRWALHEGITPTIESAWPAEPTADDRAVVDALALAADGRTNRLGRLLGSRSIRFLVVPAAPGAPDGVVEVLRRQLDLREIEIGESAAVFENEAWVPIRAVLTGAALGASELAGVDALARAALDGATPVLTDASTVTAEGPVPAGTVFVAGPIGDGWRLTVDGRAEPARPAFGWATAFEVPTAGSGVLDRPAGAARWAWTAAVGVAWLIALRLVTSGRLTPRRRRRPAADTATAVEPLIALSAGPGALDVLEPLDGADAPGPS